MAWRDADADARARFARRSTPRARDRLAVVGMGKLGGEELNYSSDIDLMFVYGDEGDTAGGPEGRIANGEYFARVCRDLVAMIEAVTEEGYAFRVDLRLRPEGRMGAVAMSLDAFRNYHESRAELWERQALLKARVSAGDPGVAARFMDWARDVVYRPGLDERVVPAIRGMKREIDRAIGKRAGEASETNVKLGRGGIREIEFLVQALQLLYGGDDPWLRERNSLKALFRLTERGYLAPELGRRLSHALVHFARWSTAADPRVPDARCRRIRCWAGLARGSGPRRRAWPRGGSSPSTGVTRDVIAPSASSWRAAVAAAGARGLPAGWRSPRPLRRCRARAPESEMIVEAGRSCRGGALRAALERLIPGLLDACWKSPDPDEA